MLEALEKGVKGGVWFSLIDKVHRPETLYAAWQRVRHAGGAAGSDQESLEQFEKRLDANLASPARQRAQRFAEAARERLPAWQARTRGAPGVLLFHKDGIYLTERLGVPVLGYLEPVPGVPPSASHLQGLRTRLQGQSGAILRHAYQPASGAENLARDLGWSVRVVALEPPVNADAAGYFGLVDQWVEAIVESR